MLVDVIDLDQVLITLKYRIFINLAAAIGIGAVPNAGPGPIMNRSHRLLVAKSRPRGTSDALLGLAYRVRHLPAVGCSAAAVALGLVLQVTPGPAFEVEGSTSFPYEKIYPFGTDVHSCTDKIYEQDGRGHYLYRGISFTSGVAFSSGDGAMILNGVDVFGSEIRPRHKVTYYRVREENGKLFILEHVVFYYRGNPVSNVNVVVQHSELPGIVNFMPEENYLTLLLQERSTNAILLEAARIGKRYGNIELNVLVSRTQELRRWSDVRPVRLELVIDLQEPEAAIRQMIEMSEIGLRAAEAMGKGKQMERVCR